MTLQQAEVALRSLEGATSGPLLRVGRLGRVERFHANFTEDLGPETDGIELWFTDRRLSGILVFFKASEPLQRERLEKGLRAKYGAPQQELGPYLKEWRIGRTNIQLMAQGLTYLDSDSAGMFEDVTDPVEPSKL
jgi:hypothetical protein